VNLFFLSDLSTAKRIGRQRVIFPSCRVWGTRAAPRWLYRPAKLGTRGSAIAFAPSLKSSVWRGRVCSASSCSVAAATRAARPARIPTIMVAERMADLIGRDAVGQRRHAQAAARGLLDVCYSPENGWCRSAKM
jgi:hypothetical protein